MATVFGNFDISDFWKPSGYAKRWYIDVPLTDELVESVERELGYTLPKAYVELMKHQNGGLPKKTFHRTSERTSWSDNHIAITGIFSIGNKKPKSLCFVGQVELWIEEWGYPPIGVYFADCPSAGHDMICLDYRKCGPKGEPQVVHVDQELDYKITFVANNFESFIRGLEAEDGFHDNA
jgi:hypothetical protein